ncbi:hypothetical protein SELMODRAFT_144613 [Selaginella moellendorffii]|uniref:DUF1264 domain-containing protein n=1 Tax=Selaginella moellendorffii TaxID=88036 RepID=D8R837_SELML|nr:oil body-associated protein 2A isoform X1 [Selaginella moellendorffii]EFJ31989.1 hypothetical protein SELMODRAFT_144613 [Selaginella moellendorffii]|eukprot:XP_002967390.1 oil body-associated protein 2A isoform X1 [Selaginella moellendorffii]
MASCDKVPAGQIPSSPDDVPGKPTTMMSKIMEKGADMLQSLEPVKQIQEHICTFAFYSHDMKRQIETHHYASRVNEDFTQCLVFDRDDSQARLIGVEYIVSDRIFVTLPDEEKKLWHSHSHEIKTGLWVHPGVPEAVQKQELHKLAPTYGKFWCTWQFDRGDRLPMGPPALMMSPQEECPVDSKLVEARDKKYNISTTERAESRRDIAGLSRVDPLADHWKASGKGMVVELKEVDMALPGPYPSSQLSL